MDRFIFDEGNGLWYNLHGDYYLPCLTVPEYKPVGFGGRRYRKYLKEHKAPVCIAMLLAGTLEDHVVEIDHRAEDLLYRRIEEMAHREGLTEQVKARDPMEWNRQMNSIQNRAMEIVNADLIVT